MRVAVALASALALPVWGLAVTLLCVAQTTGGRLTALVFIVGLPALIALIRWPKRAGPWAGIILAGALWTGAYLNAPSADDVKASGLSIYLGEANHARGALSNLVPEVDQFTLGSYLVPFVDALIDRPKSAHIRDLFQRVYAELGAEPAFANAGSTMNAAYGELWGADPRNDHLYRYPPTPDDFVERRPVLLFLHGSAGNFLGYLWVLKRFADARGWTVIAPDNGFGFWRPDAAKQVIDGTLRYIEEQADLDASRVVLAGLSNGGLGVQQALSEGRHRFEAVVLFSAVPPPALPPHPTDAPWFVLHGDADARIPIAHIDQYVTKLKKAGATVERRVVEGDHFIFFERQDAVLEILTAATSTR